MNRRPPVTRLAPPRSIVSLSTSGLVNAEVRRRERVEQVVDHEPGAQLVAPVQPGVLDEALGGTFEREIGLHQPVEQPALPPRAVAEAAVALGRRDLRAADRDPRELGAEAADAPRHAARVACKAAGQPRGGHRLHEAADGPGLDRRVGEQHVERGARGGARAGRRPAVDGVTGS